MARRLPRRAFCTARNDNFRGVIANEMKPSNNKLSSRTQCGDLGFCHYERSEVIQKQVLLAMGLLLSFHSIAMTRTASKFACDEIAFTTPQVWLVAGSHLGFAEKSFHFIAMTRIVGKLQPMRLLHPVGVRNDKFRIVMARRLLRRRGHLTASCER